MLCLCCIASIVDAACSCQTDVINICTVLFFLSLRSPKETDVRLYNKYYIKKERKKEREGRGGVGSGDGRLFMYTTCIIYQSVGLMMSCSQLDQSP